AELLRKDAAAAFAHVSAAFEGWPDDPVLHYLAGIARAELGAPQAARAELNTALSMKSDYAPARAALRALDAGTPIALDFTPELVRPWGDREAIAAALDRFTAASNDLTRIRASYQADVVEILGLVGKGPGASAQKQVTSCAVAAIAPAWSR